MKKNVMRPLTEAEMQKGGSAGLVSYIPAITGQVQAVPKVAILMQW